jgi:hypothetical protein
LRDVLASPALEQLQVALPGDRTDYVIAHGAMSYERNIQLLEGW